MNLIDAALAEAERWPVFPLNYDKRPVVAGGFMAATRDPAEIRKLFALPGAELVGVPTGEVSGIDVLDIDPDKGGFTWQDDHLHELPDTEYQLTRKPGGIHYLFKHHPGMRSSASKIAGGVDVRGDGGYIVRWSATTGSGRRLGKVEPWPSWLIVEASRKRVISTGASALQPDQLAPPDVETLVAFLDALPNPESCGRDDYVAVCMAVQGCIRGLEAMEPSLDPEPIIHAAASWAARWEGPNPGDYDAERAKWESDWGARDDDLAGWRQLCATAKRLGVDTSAVVQSSAVAAFAADPVEDEDDEDPLARLVGWRDDLIFNRMGEPLSTLENALTMLRGASEFAGAFAFDEMAQESVLTRSVGPHMRGPFPRRVTDAEVTQIQAYGQRMGLHYLSADAVWKAVDVVAKENRQHPIRNYLAGVTHDGTPRVGTWLIDYCGAEDTPVNREIGRMFLVQMVARVIRPGCQANCMLILEGVQGTGKSSVCRVLGGPWFSDALPHSIGSKEASQHLRGRWLLEVAELESMNRADTNTLKAFVTRPEERYRPPYGRAEVVEPRQCVFVGTTNKPVYLKDESGGRRFWPVRTEWINIDALERDRDQLFAEAVAMLDAGASWWPDADLVPGLEAVQESRYEADAWEPIIADWLVGKGRVETHQVLESAVKRKVADINQSDARRVGAVMERLGWERFRSNGRRQWRRIEGDPGDIPESSGDLSDMVG